MIDNQMLVYRLNLISESIGVLRCAADLMTSRLTKDGMKMVAGNIRRAADQASMNMELVIEQIFKEDEEHDQG